MSEKLLHCPYVVAVFEEMGGEGMAQGVTGDKLVYSCFPGGFFIALCRALSCT